MTPPTTTNHPRPSARPARVLIIAITWAMFWILLVLAVHRGSPRTLISFHGLLHAAIAQQFTAHPAAAAAAAEDAPALAPENPFYAGEPVCYYWFFQFLAAQLVNLTRINVFHALETVILIATAAMMLTGVYLGCRLYRNALAGILIGFLIVAGTNPFGIVFAAWNAPKYLNQQSKNNVATATSATMPTTTPDSQPSASPSVPTAHPAPPRSLVATAIQFARHPRTTLARYDSATYLWGVVHPLYSLIRFNDFGGLYGPMLNFFLNITSRPTALAALLALVLALHRLLAKRGVAAWLTLAALSALLTALSPIMGICAGGAIGAGILTVWIWARRRPVDTAPAIPPGTFAHNVLSPAAAMLLGIIAASPTYYHLLFGPSDSHARFPLFTTEGLRNLGTLFFNIGPLFLVAVFGIRRAPPTHRPLLAALIVASLPLLALCATIHLPAGNISNCFQAAAVLLAIPAAAFAMRADATAAAAPPAAAPPARLSAARTLALVALFTPTTAALLIAYLDRPPVPVRFDAPVLHRSPAESDLAALYEWVKTATPANAVFILDPRQPIAVCGNTVEFPAMTGRAIFTEHARHYLSQPYPDSSVRQDIATRMCDGAALDLDQRRYLALLRRPIYLVVHEATTAGDLSRYRAAYGSPVFRRGAANVFRWNH